jgi:hypothetical protein
MWYAARCLWLVLVLVEEISETLIADQTAVDTVGVSENRVDSINRARVLLFADCQTVPLNVAMLINNDTLSQRIISVMRAAFPQKQTMVNIYPLANSHMSIYMLYISRIWNLLRKRGGLVRQILMCGPGFEEFAQEARNRDILVKWLAEERSAVTQN